MKAIEKRIVEALRAGTSFKQSQNVYEIGYIVHDEVKADASSSTYLYYLIGTCVAVYDPTHARLSLGVESGRYDTATTRSRMNAIASAFGVCGLVQRKGKPFWTDGDPYTGPREFRL
jgi:hypothetical protein